MENASNETLLVSGLSADFSTPTIAERYFQLVVYVAFSSVSFVGYVSMAYGMAKCKETRSRFYYILIFLLLCRAMICVQIFNLILYRLLKLLDVVPNPPRYVCAIVAVMAYPNLLEAVLLFVLAADRAVALFAVAYYRKLTRTQVVKVCLLASGATLMLKFGLLFGTPSFFEPVACQSLYDAMAKEAILFAQYFEFALIVALVIAYISMLAAVHVRVKKLRAQPDNEALLIAINRQIALMPTLRNIVIVHCFWTFTWKLVLTISVLPFAATIAARCVLYGGCFAVSELFVNVVILLKTNDEVRRATINVFRPNKVHSVATPQQRQAAA